MKKLPEKKNSATWDDIAPKFNQWMEKDDYPKKVLQRIKCDANDSVLDIGCGNGVITIPLAKKANNVTAMDISGKMLEILTQKAEKSGIKNINTIKKRLEDTTVDEIGNHDE